MERPQEGVGVGRGPKKLEREKVGGNGMTGQPTSIRKKRIQTY